MAGSKWKVVCGIVAVMICTAIAELWSIWGAIENFHEGWYRRSLVQNLLLAAVQYWIWPIAFALLGVLAIRKPKIGAVLFACIGILLNVFLFGFRNSAGVELILVPCLILAVLFWFSAFPRRALAIWACAGLPILTIVAISLPLGWKVAHRITAIQDQPLVWQTGSETLVWAPPGPGWSAGGESYQVAVDTCSHLAPNGRTIGAKALNLWRLPTVEEAVHALDRGGQPAGCQYTGKPGFQDCRTEPDKEAPLWDPYSPVIYWWSATDDARGRNLRVAYNGYVLPVSKRGEGSTGFRAVRTAP